jgi:hypothetical protein
MTWSSVLTVDVLIVGSVTQLDAYAFTPKKAHGHRNQNTGRRWRDRSFEFEDIFTGAAEAGAEAGSEDLIRSDRAGLKIKQQAPRQE